MYTPGFPKNHCERICLATGAAAMSPTPPCSTWTTTRIGLLVADDGTKQTYHASSALARVLGGSGLTVDLLGEVAHHVI